MESLEPKTLFDDIVWQCHFEVSKALTRGWFLSYLLSVFGGLWGDSLNRLHFNSGQLFCKYNSLNTFNVAKPLWCASWGEFGILIFCPFHFLFGDEKFFGRFISTKLRKFHILLKFGCYSFSKSFAYGFNLKRKNWRDGRVHKAAETMHNGTDKREIIVRLFYNVTSVLRLSNMNRLKCSSGTDYYILMMSTRMFITKTFFIMHICWLDSQ